MWIARKFLEMAAKASSTAAAAVRKSASVVLIKPHDRHGGAEFSVLMMQRNAAMKFASSAMVFPGGAVDKADGEGAKSELDSLKITALRETFEECGILLSKPPVPAKRHGELAAWRDVIHDDASRLQEVFNEFGCKPDLDALTPHCGFTTPTFEPKRFETTFFLVVLSEDHAEAALDTAQESVSLQWWRPIDALKALDAGDIRMLPPQFYILKDLASIANVGALQQRIASMPHECVPRMLPVLQAAEDGAILLLPGDGEYPSEDGSTQQGGGVRHRVLITGQDRYVLEDTRGSGGGRARL